MKLRHPQSGHTIDAHPDSVPMYRSQGWEPVPPRPTKKTPAAKKASGN